MHWFGVQLISLMSIFSLRTLLERIRMHKYLLKIAILKVQISKFSWGGAPDPLDTGLITATDIFVRFSNSSSPGPKI